MFGHFKVTGAICAPFSVGLQGLILSVSALLLLPSANAQDAKSVDAPPRPLSELFREARERFVPISDKDTSAARAELVKRANELEKFVRPQTSNGRLWLTYLRWSDLKEQLAAEGTPNMAALTATYQQLNRDEAGLELERFRQVSRALRNYIDRMALTRTDDPAAFYGRQLDQLAADLERMRAAGQQSGGNATAPTSTLQIGQRLDFITGIGQAPELVAAIRKEFARPNAFLNMSAGLVRAAAEEPINRRDPVTDNILGTSISGTGHTIGAVIARVVPSADRATIELKSKGHVETQNTGRNGPAVIRSTGHTDFNATKLIELSDKAFHAPPAKVTATSRSDIHSIAKSGGGIGSRMVSSQGWSRANANRSQVNSIAADHAEDRIRRRIDDEVGKKIRDARKRYENEYRYPLARRGELPDDILFGSTEDAVTITATQASRGQLGAMAAPPEMPADLDIVLRLHDSAINNYSAVVLGGATASESEPGQDKAKFDVPLPNWMKEAWEKRKTDATPSADAAFKPWSLTFRSGRPMTVSFVNDKVSLTIHLSRLKSGDEEFTNWDVTGIFAPQIADGGVTLVREGDLEVFPSDFDRRSGQQIPSRDVAVRSNLTKVLNERSAQGRGFPNRIEFGQIEPTGTLEKVGPLDARQLKSNDGWLTLAWQRKTGKG